MPENLSMLTIIGARPQFIKAAMLSKAINLHNSKNKAHIHEVIVHTGQHFDNNMSYVFFEQMQIPKPSYNLGIGNLTHGAMTGRMVEGIEQVILEEKPEWVLVYGDTNSTLAGALAAKKLHVKIAHIEAGLRSHNEKMPEEINRIITDRLSEILFCPTNTAIKNLANEGFNNFNKKIIRCGDVMYDAALHFKHMSTSPFINNPEPKPYCLATIHRAENTDDRIKLFSILSTLDQISNEMAMVIPLHPRTRKILTAFKYDFSSSSIIFLEPVGYLQMLYLLENCHFVFTDSGGLQKESYFFEKPCITLREETEWVELIKNKCNILAGSESVNIISAYKHFLKNGFNAPKDIFGDGNTANYILEEILKGTSSSNY